MPSMMADLDGDPSERSAWVAVPAIASRRAALGLALAGLLALVLATGAQARVRPPTLTALRCVPASRAACQPRPQVMIGRQVQLRGTRLKAGMRVSFRWSTGALATRLKRSQTGWVARVPAGTKAGTVSVRVGDRGGRRSRAIRLVVLPVPVVRRPPSPGGSLPAPFAGSGMWIWQVPKSSGGDVNAIGAQARAAGITTVFVKSADGPSEPWTQFNPALVQALHQQGLHACAYQFVYGADPLGEAAQGARVVATGADCLVIDAETHYEGRYAQAQQYITALRAAVGPTYPIGLTSFPYVDYHPGLPYSVFLAPGRAQVNLPQVYWKDIGGTVDAVSARTWAHNRIYRAPVAPLGQTYQAPAPADIQRFRQVWSAYGAGGLSWWSWQATGPSTWTTLAQPPAPAAPLPDPGWPALGKGSKGDEVVWLQEHLVSATPTVPIDGVLGTSTLQALTALQTANGLPPTGTTDPATWGAVLALPLQVVDWTTVPAPRG
jgi:peptidoglycan hydrolase-like protein with peptidoglycan-binding domain